PRRGETNKNAPPLPSPLLHPMEEREKSRSLMQPWPPAFTLLELLIAVAIFAIVLTAINGVLYVAMRLRSKPARTIEEALPIQQTVAILKRDLQGIVAPGGILTGPLQSGTATGGMLPQGATTLYTCTGALDATLPWGDVQKIAYYLKNPNDSLHAAGQ